MLVHVLSPMITLNPQSGKSPRFFTSQFVSHDVKNDELFTIIYDFAQTESPVPGSILFFWGRICIVL